MDLSLRRLRPAGADMEHEAFAKAKPVKKKVCAQLQAYMHSKFTSLPFNLVVVTPLWNLGYWVRQQGFLNQS